MFFKKNKTNEAVAKRGIKKMDAVVTGAILGGIVASLYGVKKIQNKKNSENTQEIENEISKNTEKKWFFWFFRKK